MNRINRTKWLLIFASALVLSMIFGISITNAGGPPTTPADDDGTGNHHKLIRYSLPYGNKEINWNFSDPDNFGHALTWTSLTKNSYDDGKNFYVPGCVPTALGTMMHYYLNRDSRYDGVRNVIESRSNPSLWDDKEYYVDYYTSYDSVGFGHPSPIKTLGMQRYRTTYDWSNMPDSLTGSGGGFQTQVRNAISPLLLDIGIYLEADYKLNIYDPTPTGRNSGATDVGLYNGAATLKEFGFDYATSFGTTNPINNLTNFSLYRRNYEKARKIIEANLAYGNPVQLDSPGHANIIWGYAKHIDEHREYLYDKDFRSKTTTFYLYNGNGGSGNVWDTYKAEYLAPFRVLHNVFPRVPSHLEDDKSSPYFMPFQPQIVHGRVVLPINETSSLSVKAEYGFQFGKSHTVPVRIENERGDGLEGIGIYAISLPAGTSARLSVVFTSNGEPHPSYRKEYVRLTRGHSDFQWLSSQSYTADFLPPSLTMTVNTVVDALSMIEDMGEATDELTHTQLLEPNILDKYKALLIEGDQEYNIQGTGNFADALINARDFVLDGGTLVTSGKSNAFVGSLAGSGSPRFYSFSGVPRPSATTYKTNTTIAVSQTDIIERLGGVRTFQMESTLTQKQQPLISSWGSANIISIGAYLFETLEWWGGYPSLSYYLEYIPNAVEYDLGENGGKVIYVNGELTKNYEAGGLAKAFAEAILDPVIMEEDDEVEIKEGLAGTDYYYNSNAKPIATTRTNLNMVIYGNGIKVSNNKINEDISLVLNISRRKANSIAPQDDLTSNDVVAEQDFAVTLLMPSGDVYATHRAIPSESMISIGVPAIDNIRSGNWKYRIDECNGFDGDSAVIMSVVDGLFDLHLNALNEFLTANSEDMIVPRAYSRVSAYSKINEARSFPRGLAGDTYYHRLGDSRNILNNASAKKVAFGPFVNPKDVKVWRIDDDLVLGIAGVTDSLTIPGWFSRARGSNDSISEVSFFNGTTLSATELNNMAEEREPDIVFTVISTDAYVAGTDGNDNLIGHAGQNDIFFAGKGDDIITGNGGSNVYYYRKGDGTHTVINKKNEGEANVLRFDFDITSDDVEIFRSDDDLVFAVADSGSVIIKKWYIDTATKLDRTEFAGGFFLDARDLEKLAAGESLTARTLYINSSGIDPEIAMNDNAGKEDNEAKTETTFSDGGSSGCNAGGIAFGLMLLLGVCSTSRFRGKSEK